MWVIWIWCAWFEFDVGILFWCDSCGPPCLWDLEAAEHEWFFYQSKNNCFVARFFKHIHHTSKQMLVRLHVCSSTKISIATPWMVTGNSGGWGGIKSQTFKVKVEFPEEWGFEPKNPPWKGYGYFLEPHFFTCACSCCIYVKWNYKLLDYSETCI